MTSKTKFLCSWAAAIFYLSIADVDCLVCGMLWSKSMSILLDNSENRHQYLILRCLSWAILLVLALCKAGSSAILPTDIKNCNTSRVADRAHKDLWNISSRLIKHTICFNEVFTIIILHNKLTGISFISVPVMVTGIQFLTNPPCLLNGTLVIIQCVTFGFPRPQITFNKGTMPIRLGISTFNNFGQLDYDTLNLTVIGSDDQGVYSCTAWNRDMEPRQSPHKRLLFCSKC